MDRVKLYYMTIYSTAYSPCGNYLAAGNNYGDIAIFNLSSLFDGNDIQLDEKLRHPFFKFTAHSQSPIYTLVSVKKLLLSGSVGEICAWHWGDIKKKESKPLWCWTIPQGDALTKSEVNSIALYTKDNASLFYAGCGDNKVYCGDIETGTILFSFSGHTDYIHAVCLLNGQQECLSGSEDGSVRIWDARKGGKQVKIIEPFKHQMAARPQLGNWIGCVAIHETDEWLVCGGGPALCMWHLGSLLPSTKLVKDDATSTVAHFHEDTVISGGSEPFVNHWRFDGTLVAEVPTSGCSVFDINIKSAGDRQLLCASGGSYKIDVCKDFRVKEFSLCFT